eukprot:7389561-Prymnesium_polylepis.1
MNHADSHWAGEPNLKKYFDKATARWRMSSVCTQMMDSGTKRGWLSPCRHHELTVNAALKPGDRCSMCEAITKDIYHITRMARERPTHTKNETYATLQKKVAGVCDDLELWHTIKESERDDVAAGCNTFTHDFRKLLDTLLLKRTADYARNFCNKVAQVCRYELGSLPFSDDGKDTAPKYRQDEL